MNKSIFELWIAWMISHGASANARVCLTIPIIPSS